jgi:peptidoglycan hydrolase-like protein with peptidoglycan-binding domain
MKIVVISAGHSSIVRGAAGPEPWGLDEFDENVRVVNRVAELLRSAGVDVTAVIDTQSDNQDENLNWLINEHNERTRDRDISIHFNSDGTTEGTRGVEVYYGSDREWAADISAEIAISSGLIDRGAKDGTHLKWVRETEMPAQLIEVCFVNAHGDVNLYHQHFEDICRAIAETIGDITIGTEPPPPGERPPGPEEPPHEPHPPFPEWPDRPEDVPIDERPTLRQGDEGDDVRDMQRMIPRFSGEFDGDFGPVTRDNVIRYQRSRGLDADGICGPTTWEALYSHKLPVPPPPAPPGALTLEQQVVIMRIAEDSWIADYSWDDRGVGPDGWIMGLALSFAQSYKKLKVGHPAVERIARANTHDDDDVCMVYRAEFDNLGMSNETGGPDVLRHIYAFLIGMAMRESSGQHCCGRDQSADNTDSETCEAGMFQQSHNSFSSDSTLEPLMDEYEEGLSPGYLEAFSTGVSCSSADWECYGSGRGYDFQVLAKNAPAFSAEACAVGLRVLKDHWGPVLRKEVELRKEADDMLLTVQAYVDESEPSA